MPDRDREMVRELRTLADMHVRPEATRRALLRAAEVVNQSDRRLNLSRLIVRSAIAAVLMLGLSILLVVWPDRAATAAQQLRNTAQASANYKGWVHTRAKIEILDEAAVREKMRAEGAPNMPMPVSDESHYDARTGSAASVKRLADGRIIATFMSVSDRTLIAYDSTDGKIRISVMSQVTADSLVRSRAMQPGSAEYLLKRARAGDRTVTSRDDGGLRRFDIAGPPEQDRLLPMTIWADPQTGLVQKVISEMTAARFTVEASYGPPAVTSIYDLGVPRDAPVVDNRPSDSLQEVYRAIEAARGDHGVGDHVSLLSQTYLDPQGAVNERVGAIYLLARRGNAWLNCRYLVGEKTYNNKQSRAIAVALPQAWPKPALHPLLQTLFGTKASDYVVYDGDEGWRGSYNADGSGPEYVISSKDHRGAVAFVGFRDTESIEYLIWPSPETGEGLRTEVIHDEQRPDLIGLRTTFTPTWPRPASSIRTVWLDPSRNYTIVEAENTSINEDDRTVAHRLVKDFAQLPDGRWVPSSWVSTTTQYDPQGKVLGSDSQLYTLQVMVGQTLDQKWFTDPAERLRNTEP
jgi:hypothetical protein